MTLPEARQIGRHLHRALIGCEQMQHYGDAPAGNARPVLHPEKILQTRLYPWRLGRLGRLARLVVDAHVAPPGYRDAFGRGLTQQSLLLGAQARCESLPQFTLFRCGAQFGEAAAARTQFEQRRLHVVVVQRGEFSFRKSARREFDARQPLRSFFNVDEALRVRRARLRPMPARRLRQRFR